MSPRKRTTVPGTTACECVPGAGALPAGPARLDLPGSTALVLPSQRPRVLLLQAPPPWGSAPKLVCGL